MYRPHALVGARSRPGVRSCRLGGLTLDINVHSFAFGFENEVPRELVIQLRVCNNSFPRPSVYDNLGVIEQANSGNGWRTISAGVSGPNDPELLLGWCGAGGENLLAGEPGRDRLRHLQAWVLLRVHQL